MSGLVAERAGGHIKLSGANDRRSVDVAGALPGARFVNPEWSYPLTLTNLAALREAFEGKVTIGPALAEWAREQAEAEVGLHRLAQAMDTDLYYVSDKINDAMAERTYQRVGAGFIADAGSCLIADQPGLGKTIELLAGLQEANPDVETRYHLVFAPLVAVSAVWPGETAHWCGPEFAVCYPIRGTAGRGTLRWKRRSSGSHSGLDVYVVCNLEMARLKATQNDKGKRQLLVRDAYYPELFAREWDTVIVDESHRALIKSGKVTQVRAGLMKLRAKQRIALSGTPMRGKPEYLWGTLNWLRPDVYTSYWDWVAQYWSFKPNHFSRYELGGFQPGGEDRLAADLRSIMLRRTKAEVLPELPPKLYAGTYLIPDDDGSPHAVWLEMTPEARKRYETFVAEGTVKLPEWLGHRQRSVGRAHPPAATEHQWR